MFVFFQRKIQLKHIYSSVQLRQQLFKIKGKSITISSNKMYIEHNIKVFTMFTYLIW